MNRNGEFAYGPGIGYSVPDPGAKTMREEELREALEEVKRPYEPSEPVDRQVMESYLKKLLREHFSRRSTR